MKYFVACVMVATLAVTAAFAQETQATPTYTWEARPDGYTFARNYPQRAVDEGVQGAAVVCCTVRSDRTLNCTSPLEWPAGYGFGESSIAASREFRMSESSYAEIRSDPNHVIRRTVRWVLPPGAVDLPAEFTERARTVCNGPAVPVS